MTTKIVILRETLLQSIIIDIFTLLTTVGMVGIGVWLESTALQWVGAIMSMIAAFGMVQAIVSNSYKYTINDARKKLDEMERGDKR